MVCFSGGCWLVVLGIFGPYREVLVKTLNGTLIIHSHVVVMTK